MRFARATLTAAMATSLVITTSASSSTTVHQHDSTELQQELHHLAYIMKEISEEHSWSLDTLPSNDNGYKFSSSLDEESVRQWMNQKELEVESYYTLLSADSDDDRSARRSSMAAQHDNNNGDEYRNNKNGHFEQRLDGRRHLRTTAAPLTTAATATSERQAPTDAEVDEGQRELGKRVGMKRNDPRAAGRFTPSEGRTPPRGRDDPPPKGRDGDSSSDQVAAGGGGGDGDGASAGPGSLNRGPQEGVTKESPSKPLRTETTSSTGSRWSHHAAARDHQPKSMKQPPPPPRAQQFPNAVYVQHPPPQHHHQQQQIVVVEEVEECYDVEELMAMGLLLNIQQPQQQQAPVYRYDGTLLNHESPGSRRSLQQYQYQQPQPQPQSQQYMQYPYNYWTWDAQSKSAKSPKVNTVYVSQQPPPASTTTQMVYGQQAPPPQTTTQMVVGQQPPPPPPQTVYVGQQQPPSTTNTILYINHGSKSAKSKSSKSSKMAKMTKSGKLCSHPLPPPPPLPPSICGTSLLDASTNCAQLCHKDSDCPEVWDICIPNVQACAQPTPGYCGVTLEQASQCTLQCWNDDGCPMGQTCFAAGTQVIACEIPSEEMVGYCGSEMNVVDAGRCDTECNSDADCPTGQSCFDKDDVECISDTGYCGSSLVDASKCTAGCGTSADCPSGETCYSQSVVTCVDDDTTTGYCGSSLLDASKCAVECTSSADCPGGEGCYSSAVVTCADDTTGYCGSSLLDASKCDDVCTSDGDCPGGESCFVGSVECKPGFCGADGDDATKCQVPCSSDVGCPSGESCFTGVECAAPCPTGCKDCDPDSPLPCPNPMMKQVCDKQNDTLYPPGSPRAGERISNFKDCYDMCKPSFCCIHASQSKVIAPTCAKEYDNCPLYYPCYIIWWKLHDTIGPAPYLRVEQKEPFFNVKLDQLQEEFKKDPAFENQLFGHHFDTDDPLKDEMFEDPENW